MFSTGFTSLSVKLYNFSILNELTQTVNFPTWIPYGHSHSLALLNFFLSYDDSICSTIAVPPLRNSDHVVISVTTDFLDVPFHHKPMIILLQIGMVFVIICKMCHGRVSLNSMLLLLLVNIVSGFRLELMYISLIKRNVALRMFGKLLTVFSTKVNLLYHLYSTAWKCCVLHLIKQNC